MDFNNFPTCTGEPFDVVWVCLAMIQMAEGDFLVSLPALVSLCVMWGVW